MSDLMYILNKLPDSIKHPLESLPMEIKANIEEIRLQVGQPIRIRTGIKEMVLELNNSQKMTGELLDIILNNLLNYSIYAYDEDLSKGYLTIEGGHRVGVCGHIVTDKGNVTLIKEISSLNIRRSREIIGISNNLIKEIVNKESGLQNTLIVSPPKCGKTTLLRDLVRSLSYSGFRIGVCDERSEIAGMYQRVPSYDLGPRTDVLDGCKKSDGILMLIRSMSPDVIITDEIGKQEDIEAIEAALCAGVKLITTIHGNSYEDIITSKLGSLIETKVFTRIIFLTNTPKTGTIREVRYV